MTPPNARRTLVRRGLRTIVMLGATLPGAARAQSDVAFPKSVYVERRARLATRVEGAMVVIAGRYLINPGDALVKQDPNFWYLTGVESPYTVLVIASANDGVARSTLFIPEQLQFAGGQFPMDEPAFRRAPWNRPRRRLAPGASAVQATGVDESYPLAEFAERFRAMARDARVIYAPAGEELFAPAGLVAAGSFERQFRASLVPLAPNAEFRDLSPVVGQMLTYTTDLCRTWPVSGRFSAVQRKYYDIVLEAQEAAISAIRPGDMMLDVIKAAARVFQKHGLEPNEDIATMGVDRVWGIMPSPTHYLTRDAGIVWYNSIGGGVRDLGHQIGLEEQDSRDYSRPSAPGSVCRSAFGS